jgi:hypothetical protein
VEGAGSFAFTNVIAHPAASIYRNNNLTNVASIVVNGASVSPGRTAYFTGGGNVQTAFDGNYIDADPQYVDTDVPGALSGGTVRRWDSRANTAYDVLNRDFATAGSGGGRLTGGAQLGFALGTMITIK